MRRVLFIFLDGVGIGASDRDRNPFLRAQLPTLRELTGGRLPTLDEPVVRHEGGGAFPLAATLDVEGTPQSGTGQVAILTGATSVRGRPCDCDSSSSARASSVTQVMPGAR